MGKEKGMVYVEVDLFYVTKTQCFPSQMSYLY